MKEYRVKPDSQLNLDTWDPDDTGCPVGIACAPRPSCAPSGRTLRSCPGSPRVSGTSGGVATGGGAAVRSPTRLKRAARKWPSKPRRPRATTPRKPRPGLHPKPPKTTARLPYADAQRLSIALIDALRDAAVLPSLVTEAMHLGQSYVFAGSLRRMAPTVGDLDLLLIEQPWGQWAWGALPTVHGLALHAFGPAKATGVFTHGRQRIPVDIRAVAPSSLGAALEYFTGPAGHNLGMRMKAKRKGYKLNEYGLFSVKTGFKIAGDTEASIYDALGHDWKPPELRGR